MVQTSRTILCAIVGALALQATSAAQAAPDGRKYKMLSAPIVLGTYETRSTRNAGAITAKPRRQPLYLPAVQAIRQAR